MRIIGAAEEFWRLRLTRLDTTEGLEFEWHDDILYREPHPNPGEEVELWTIEAVRVDDYDALVRVATFADRGEAEAFYERARVDLSEMTKTQFEESYLESSKNAPDEDTPDAEAAGHPLL